MKTVRTWRMLARIRRALKNVVADEIYSRLGEWLDDLYDRWGLVG